MKKIRFLIEFILVHIDLQFLLLFLSFNSTLGNTVFTILIRGLQSPMRFFTVLNCWFAIVLDTSAYVLAVECETHVWYYPAAIF